MQQVIKCFKSSKKTRLNSSIGCILVKFRIVTLFLQQNTTTGWIHLRFSGMYEDVSVCKNIFPRFVTCIKLTRNSTISCILFKIRIMMLCSHNNTTCGWIWLLFSAAYEDMSGRKKYLSTFRHPHKTDLKYNRGLNLSWFTTLWINSLKLETPRPRQPRVALRFWSTFGRCW